ncbi:MAG: efflux RND transporter periplasmic adaptor subunit [Lewinella sp.]|nr:efflux RND transporter periplasmic adaptor subunit [Lewinella sp.]
MKYLLPLLLLILATGCQAPTKDGEIPADLEGKKTLLREKQTELQALTREIEELQAAILEQDPEATPQGALVTTQTLSRGSFAHYVTVQGSVMADDFIDVTPEVGGRILRLTVDEGDAVRRGQLIAELDDEQIQKQIAELETSLQLANTVYERQKRLWDQNIGSEIQYLQAESNKDRLEKNLELLQLQLGKTEVYAPANGVVDRVLLQAGELAAPGAPILLLLNTADLKVEADVPETYITAVHRGEVVKVTVPALNLDTEAPVSLIGQTIDPANRTFKVEVKLPHNSLLKPNLLAEMQIEDFAEEDAVSIPLDRVQQEVSGKRYVFTVAEGEDGPVAKKVYIEIGRSYNGDVIITSGLEGNEQLILEGARELSDGQLLRIVNEQTPTTNE